MVLIHNQGNGWNVNLQLTNMVSSQENDPILQLTHTTLNYYIVIKSITNLTFCN
jgi:hypothetical protein